MTPPSNANNLASLRNMIDALDDPCILIDRQYQILHANHAYRMAFGEDAIGHSCYELSHSYERPCDLAGETCPLAATLASGEPQRVLHVHHTASGAQHVDVELSPFSDANGDVTYFIERMKLIPHTSSEASPDKLVGQSAPFRRMLLMASRVARSHAAVLLLGESGTGKEELAKSIHDASQRHHKPFVPVDCSSLTESLLESELFGHEKGAFTGATQRKQGLVEAAAGGTLFLDEVGDIPLAQQVKLLRLLESGTFRRVGGVEPVKASFRLISATHRPLTEMVRAGEFRTDLYYRLATFPIELPALRQRRDDIPLLAKAMLQRVAPERDLALSPAALAQLMNYDFPGNIRELRNIIERASLLADGQLIEPEHLALSATDPATLAENPFQCPLIPLEQLEQRYLRWAFLQYPQDRAALARQLGISERTLYRKLGKSLPL